HRRNDGRSTPPPAEKDPRLLHHRRRPARESADHARGRGDHNAHPSHDTQHDADPAHASKAEDRTDRGHSVIARAPGKLVLSNAYSILKNAPYLVAAIDRYVIANADRATQHEAAEMQTAVATGAMDRTM